MEPQKPRKTRISTIIIVTIAIASLVAHASRNIFSLAKATSLRPLSVLAYVLFDLEFFVRDFIIKLPVI